MSALRMKFECIAEYKGFSESDGVAVEGPPTYATAGAAAIDLRTTKCVTLRPGQAEPIRTGFKVAMPDGVAALLLPRSGLGSKGIQLSNTVGLIDSDYRGEIVVMLVNRGLASVRLLEGDRVAQLMFIPYIKAELVEVDQFSTTTARGEGGFGSTGGAASVADSSEGV